jgi:hypothetical protein
MSISYNDQWVLQRGSVTVRGQRIAPTPHGEEAEGCAHADSWARTQDCSRWALGSLEKHPRWIDRDT